MAFHKPDKMLNIALEAGVSKTKLSLSSILMLGFLGGAFIALGFLLDVRVIGNLPAEWGSLSNLLGAIFIAYFFGHIVGLTETGPFLDKTVAIAQAKIDESFFKTLISAVGCNWLVCLAIWLSYGADDVTGKILGIWFPIMAFVAIGFQHVVANMFIIPAAIFAGHFTWIDFLTNIVPTFIGNMIGGAVFVGLIYFSSYQSKQKEQLKKAS